MVSNSDHKTHFESKTEKKIPLKTKMNYAVMVAAMTLMGGIAANLEYFYVNYLHLDAWLFGIAHLIFAIINALNDPIMGYFMDKKPPSKKGNKFARFMLISIPFFILGIITMLIGQPSWGSAALIFCVVLGLSIRDTGDAIFSISLNSLAIETSESDSDRGSFVGVNLIFQTFLGIVTFVLPFLLLTKGYLPALWMFIGFGVGSVVIYTIGAIFVQNKNLPKIVTHSQKLFPILKRVFKQKTYRYYFGISFLVTAIAANQQGFFIFYLDGVLGLGDQMALAMGIMLPLNFLIYIFAGKLLKKLGIRKMLYIAVSLMLVGYTGMLIPIQGIFGAIIPSVSFLGATAWWITQFPFNGTMIDEYELKYGERNEGTVFGINALVGAPAGSIGLFLFSTIISIPYFNYIKQTGQQLPLAQLGIRIGIAGVAVILLIITLILITKMPKVNSEKKREATKL